MAGLIKHIEGIVGTAAKRSTLRPKGNSKCSINLNSLKGKPYVAIDIDVALDNKCIPSIEGKKCDYLIIVCEGSFYLVFPVEVKKTRADIKEIKGQIEGGLKIFNNLTQGKNITKEKIKLIPCYLARSEKKPQSKARKKKENGISFMGSKEFISFVKCGKDFFNEVENHI